MSFPQNRFVVIGGSVLGVLLAAELIFLLLIQRDFKTAQRELKTAERRLNQLHNRAPYPSEKNVEQLKKNLDGLEYQVGEIRAAVSQNPFPKEAEEAADFCARAQEVIERFQKRAERAGVELPDSLEVGFAKYASGGAVPEAAHVPRLSRQLYSVEQAANILLDCGVLAIEEVTREVFDAEKKNPEPPRRRRRNEPDPPEIPPELVGSKAHPDGLFLVERIGLVFSAKEETVWQVLSRISNAPHFMVITEFEHTAQTEILSYNPEAVKRGNESDDETLQYLAGGILVGEKALSRPERIIAGNEPVRVRLSVDVYNFDAEVKK